MLFWAHVCLLYRSVYNVHVEFPGLNSQTLVAVKKHPKKLNQLTVVLYSYRASV